MSYEPSNTIRLPYNTNETTPYTSINRPTTVTSPSLNPPYNNPNGTGEHNSIAVKGKRGRPRKYVAADGSPPGQGDASELFSSGSGSGSGKRPRGRPPGSLNKQHSVALVTKCHKNYLLCISISSITHHAGSPGVGFMPHILDVKAREDVIAKMMWFSQNGNRALCVLSANGAVSNVTLRQSTASGGTVTYEGNFEILSLSGSFMVSEVDGQRIRTGGISVSLSGPDGRVLGGNVAGILTAAGPVQVVVGSFVPASQKQTKTQGAGTNEAEVVNAPHNESSGGGLGSPFDHRNTNGNPQAMANMTWR